MLRSKRRLVDVREIKVVNAADDGMDALVLEGRRQGGDQRRLAGALDAVEANDQRRGSLPGSVGVSVTGSVQGEVLEYKWHAYRSLVVHKGSRHYAEQERTVHGAISFPRRDSLFRNVSAGG